MESWQGQVITSFATLATVHPWWGQIALNALKVPSAGCVTTTLSWIDAAVQGDRDEVGDRDTDVGPELPAPGPAPHALSRGTRDSRDAGSTGPSQDGTTVELGHGRSSRSRCPTVAGLSRSPCERTAAGDGSQDLLRRFVRAFRRRGAARWSRGRSVREQPLEEGPGVARRIGRHLLGRARSVTTRPPPVPPSGPMSMTQSAVLITSRLCSITMTVLPLSTRLWSTPSSLRMSSKCRPVVGSSST